MHRAIQIVGLAWFHRPRKVSEGLVQQVWQELGESMRLARRGADLSLRQVEAKSGWRRGTLSLVENGKARPSWELVQWYDRAMGSDGLLLSLYIEARSAPPVIVHDHSGPGTAPTLEPEAGRTGRRAASDQPGDAGEYHVTAPPSGSLVRPGEHVSVCWRVRNSGRVVWRGRRLARVGPAGGARVISGAGSTLVPDLGPGQLLDGEIEVVAPTFPGSYVAYWQLTDSCGNPTLTSSPSMCVVLIVDDSAVAT